MEEQLSKLRITISSNSSNSTALSGEAFLISSMIVKVNAALVEAIDTYKKSFPDEKTDETEAIRNEMLLDDDNSSVASVDDDFTDEEGSFEENWEGNSEEEIDAGSEEIDAEIQNQLAAEMDPFFNMDSCDNLSE